MSRSTDRSRREFLKNTGAVLGASGVAALGTSATAAKSSVHGRFRVGAAQRDISPEPGLIITHYLRKNIGIHDPIFVRAMIIEDGDGTSVALLTGDFIGCGFAGCDEIRARVKKNIGVDEVWFSCSHTHAGRWLVSTPVEGRERTDEFTWDEGADWPITDDPKEVKWNAGVHRAIDEMCAEAKQKMVPVTLNSGRAKAQVGYNRRVTDKDGYTYMGVNREGPIVPWVTVLVANSIETKKPVAMFFEHAAHPVTVPHHSKLVSNDFPGAAIMRIREKLGDDCIALFGQGCSANINSFPLRSTHQDAENAGHKLGDAVLQAIADSQPVTATKLTYKTVKTELPTRELASAELVTELTEKELKRKRPDPARLKQLKKITAKRESGTPLVPRPFAVSGVMLGDDWGLIAMNYELFSQIELWIDKAGPFRHTAVCTLTNGGRGYIGTDKALALENNGGYEAGCLPNWGAHETMSPNLSPPAVGTEVVIKKAIEKLWS